MKDKIIDVLYDYRMGLLTETETINQIEGIVMNWIPFTEPKAEMVQEGDNWVIRVPGIRRVCSNGLASADLRDFTEEEERDWDNQIPDKSL